MHAGAAAVGAGAAGAPSSSGASSGLGPYQIAELVAYLPQELFEQQAGQQRQQQAQQQSGAFTLPLLQQAGSSNNGGTSSSGSDNEAEQQLSEDLAAALLAGARDIARQAASAAGVGHSSDGQQQQQPPAASRRRSEPGGAVVQLVRSAAASLADWWAVQQGRACPVTKRTLGELTAFQLPNQTNRLAVQFDPFSRPQVRTAGVGGASKGVQLACLQQCWCRILPGSSGLCSRCWPAASIPLLPPACPPAQPAALPPTVALPNLQVPFISGIEVFEPGHCTTPHVHPHAHELFFILAGEGTGFCGSERFPVRAGDVVVFRPGALHGIDNSPDSRMYCLELMVPNEVGWAAAA
jgi:hypothetical protein